MSPLNSALLSPRDGVATLAHAPSPGSASVVKTITAQAVQHVRIADPSDALPRKTLAMTQEKRGRLVGPPPTFEVNVLQHLRETRMLPDDTNNPPSEAREEPEAVPDPGERVDTDTGPRKAPSTAYDALTWISQPDGRQSSEKMDFGV